MDQLYVYIVGFLLLLAIIDLIVGVSNDAVNFLNSAIGSRVSSRRNIMIIASMGILVGVSLSTGMMEVARKGIFNPQLFTFSDVMVIFLAVMLTDIFLLDLFNTHGLPTSTTVSIVFELLGTSVIVALLKTNFQVIQLEQYINTTSALVIISGIFLSVGIAFVAGSIVQFISRVIFSYDYREKPNYKAIIWSSMALTILLFFILIKGASNNIFMTEAMKSWINSNVGLIIIACAFSSFLITAILWVLKIDLFKIIVLVGTFSLALSFASNDLVNFVGVPLAGFQSFKAWGLANAAADSYTMSILNQPIRTDGYLLIIAGVIMIITLWLSKKARSVTETEVNLASHDTDNERFKPNRFSSGLVKLGLKSYNVLKEITPKKVGVTISNQLDPKRRVYQKNPPAFDTVRAAVNLTTASILISLATSLKLPLSTTYVSFMVAMGTALADRAWGRKSAANRISGVLVVLGGWFFTAFIAFIASSIFALMIYLWGIMGMGVVLVVVSGSLIYNHRVFRKKDDKRSSV